MLRKVRRCGRWRMLLRAPPQRGLTLAARFDVRELPGLPCVCGRFLCAMGPHCPSRCCVRCCVRRVPGAHGHDGVRRLHAQRRRARESGGILECVLLRDVSERAVAHRRLALDLDCDSVRIPGGCHGSGGWALHCMCLLRPHPASPGSCLGGVRRFLVLVRVAPLLVRQAGAVARSAPALEARVACQRRFRRQQYVSGRASGSRAVGVARHFLVAPHLYSTRMPRNGVDLYSTLCAGGGRRWRTHPTPYVGPVVAAQHPSHTTMPAHACSLNPCAHPAWLRLRVPGLGTQARRIRKARARERSKRLWSKFTFRRRRSAPPRRSTMPDAGLEMSTRAVVNPLQGVDGSPVSAARGRAASNHGQSSSGGGGRAKRVGAHVQA